MSPPKCQVKNHFEREITLFCLDARCNSKWGCQKCLSSHHKSHNCISVAEFQDHIDEAKKTVRSIIDMKFSEAILLLEEASKLVVKKIQEAINAVQKTADIIQDAIFKDADLLDTLLDGFKNENFTEVLSNEYLNRILEIIQPQSLQHLADQKQDQITQLTKYAGQVLEQVSKFTIVPLNEVTLGIKLREFQEGEFQLAVKEYKSSKIGNCYLVTNGRLTRVGQYDDGQRYGIWSEVLYYDQYRDFSITFRGQYNAGVRVNKWLYFDQDQSIIGGGMYKEGKKIGFWIEPEVFQGKWGIITAIHKGEYDNGDKIGYWWTYYGSKGQVGGGAYSHGLKQGFWTDVHAYPGFMSSIGIVEQGEYVNDIRIGLWLISDLNGGQIGCGQYSQIGYKEGQWTEVEVHVGVGCSVILLHVGEYNEGHKIGFWKILDLCRNKIGGGQYKSHKEGSWIEVEVSVGWRCSQVLLHKGEYRKGVKVGVWNIYKEGSDTVQVYNQYSLGGGCYENSQKDGKWTDIGVHCGYFSTKTLIYTGDYSEGVRTGKWVTSEQSEGVIGGGFYSKTGQKELEWIDVELQVGWRCFVIIQSQGEYVQDRKQGLWVTKLLNGSQLGGGCYNRFGVKEGGWKEVEIHIGVGKYLALFHIGEYQNGVRIGKWAVQNENREKVSSGFYTKSGNKEGEWLEIQTHDGIQDTITLLHSGEYNDGLRVGKWNIESVDKYGGGHYSLSGVKEGVWQEIECHKGYNSEVLLQWNGSYSNGIKNGKWIIRQVSGEIIGGGQFSDKGQKMGQWIDVDVRVGGGCEIILKYLGDYNDGIRVGEWRIEQFGGKSINGGGKYSQKGFKEGDWIDIDPHTGYCNLIILKQIGQYKQSIRIGKWIIKSESEIGGGQYMINGLKDGKWIELYQQYFDTLTITSGNYTNGHKLQEWEFNEKLLKDL